MIILSHDSFEIVEVPTHYNITINGKFENHNGKTNWDRCLV